MIISNGYETCFNLNYNETVEIHQESVTDWVSAIQYLNQLIVLSRLSR